MLGNGVANFCRSLSTGVSDGGWDADVLSFETCVSCQYCDGSVSFFCEMRHSPLFLRGGRATRPRKARIKHQSIDDGGASPRDQQVNNIAAKDTVTGAFTSVFVDAIINNVIKKVINALSMLI